MPLTKEEEKLILKHKVKILRWDLSTYMSVKANIKAIDEIVSRLQSCSMDSAPPTDEVIGGKVTGGKATEYDSSVEALGIKVIDYQSEKKSWTTVIDRIDKAMLKLNQYDRNMIEMFFFKGCTHAMIGNELGYSPDGSRKKIHRILVKMSKFY